MFFEKTQETQIGKKSCYGNTLNPIKVKILIHLLHGSKNEDGKIGNGSLQHKTISE